MAEQQEIKILQISDIHFKNLPKGHDDYWRLRKEMVANMKTFLKNDESIDYLFICGDIAFKADANEYKIAYNFISEICTAIGCDLGDVFVVPGNHDSNRDITDKYKVLGLHAKLAFDNNRDDCLNNILQDEAEPATLSSIFDAFKSYDAFSSLYNCNEPTVHEVITTRKHEITKSPELYWEKTLEKSLNGYKINVYGVNTALISDRYDYNGTDDKQGHRLFLPKMTYNVAINDKNHINILMAHHPLNFLVDDKTIKDNFDIYYQLQFFGHVHISDSDNNNGRVHIYSGALQPPKEEKNTTNGNHYIPVFNLVTLSRSDTNDGYKAVKVKLDSFKWIFDKDIFQQDSPEEYIIKLTDDKEIPNTDNNVPLFKKTEIYRQYIHRRDRQSIINKVIPDFYKENDTFKANDDRFIMEVDQKNLWEKLFDNLKQ